jgi:quercetin dioxygenase-like cupin family protein
LGQKLAEARTETLVKTQALEVIRLVAPAGKEFSTHEVPGEITVQCLEGVAVLTAGETERRLAAGELVYLAGSTPHSLRAVEDASVLLTILLPRNPD